MIPFLGFSFLDLGTEDITSKQKISVSMKMTEKTIGREYTATKMDTLVYFQKKIITQQTEKDENAKKRVWYSFSLGP